MSYSVYYLIIPIIGRNIFKNFHYWIVWKNDLIRHFHGQENNEVVNSFIAILNIEAMWNGVIN